MIKRTTLVLSLAALTSIGSASIAQAQVANPLKFTVGYTVGAAVDYRVPLTPLGFRAEGNYSSFDAKDTGGAEDASLSDLGLNANVVFWLPNAGSPMRAYLTGGPSYSRIKVSASSGSVDLSASDNNWGFNVGGGIDFPLGALSTRLDVRYKRISSDNFFGSGETGTVQYIPITFGITF
jgi:opacity protein-like surface antigen